MDRIIPKKKSFHLTKEFIGKQKLLFSRLYDMVLWPIIEPLVPSIKEVPLEQFKDGVRKLFFHSIQNPNASNKNVTHKYLPASLPVVTTNNKLLFFTYFQVLRYPLRLINFLK